MVRKMMSVSTVGMINYKSSEEKLASAAARSSRANAKVAKQEVKLLKEQRKALKKSN